MAENPQSNVKAREVALLLRNADRLVKEGQHDGALEVIGKARSIDPKNPYAMAYEERVRSLMRQKKEPGQASVTAAVKPPSQGTPPTLGRLSELAMQEAQRRERMQAPATRMTESARREDDIRRSAIEGKVQELLKSAEQYRAKKEFGRALDEVSRAYLLDPERETTRSMKVELQRAVEEEKRRAEEERVRKEREAEERKQQLLQTELARLQREKEERQNKEEEARKRAQQEKIHQYIARSQQLLQGGQFEAALNELAFVVVIDPFNEEAFALQASIRERQEQARREEEERQRQKEEQERQKRAAVEAAIQKNMENALQLAGEGRFNEALRIITRAYVVDPANDALPACEQKIIAMQEEARAADETRRLKEEEEQQRKKEQELALLEQQERERLAQGESEAAEERRRVAKLEIEQHLVDARNELASGHYDNALAEVALAFLVDPFDQDVKTIEDEILAAQEQSRREADQQTETVLEESVPEDTSEVVKSHILEAKRLREHGEYERALDELAKAFVLDPLNDEVQRCETEIEEARRRVEELEESAEALAQAAAAQQPEAAETADQHLQQALEFFAAGSNEEALTEIAFGLTIDPGNQELEDLEKRIWADENAKNQPAEPAEQQEETARLVQIHLLAAEEFQKQNDFVAALDEVTRAYVIDPTNIEIKKLEVRIRQNQSRQNQSNVQSLKLVYPHGRAAGGTR